MVNTESIPLQIADHKFHGHESVDLANHQKSNQTQAITGKFVIKAYEGKAEVPLKHTEDQAKTYGTHQCRQGIEAQRMHRTQTRP